MASLNVAARFDLIVEALTLVEEQGSVDLEAFAMQRSLTVDQLKQVLEPVLYLEFIDGVGNRYDGTHSYLVTERDELIVDSDNWLRDAVSVAPSPSHALQLLVAGTVAQSAMTRPLLDLDRALKRLNTVVDAAVTIDIARPRYVNLCEQALAHGNVLHLRYFAESRGEPREYDIEPGFVGSNWGHWYLMGHVAGVGTPRTFRIDRIIEATETDQACNPDTTLRLSQWWDLEEERRTLGQSWYDQEYTFLPANEPGAD